MARIGLLTLGATFRPAKKAHLPDTSSIMIQSCIKPALATGLASSGGGGLLYDSWIGCIPRDQ